MGDALVLGRAEASRRASLLRKEATPRDVLAAPAAVTASCRGHLLLVWGLNPAIERRADGGREKTIRALHNEEPLHRC